MSFLNKYDVQVQAASIEVSSMDAFMELCDDVSLEAFSTGDLGNYLNKKAAIIGHGFKEAFNSLTTFNHKRPEVLNTSSLQRMLSTVDYTDLMELTFHKPVGMIGQYEDYIKLLSNHSYPALTGIITQVLIPAQKRFGYYLNNPGDINQRHKFEYGSRYTLNGLADLLSVEASSIEMGNHTGTATFGNLFESKMAFVNTATMLNQMNLERFRLVSPDKVKVEVDKLAKLADTLLNQLSSNGQQASAPFVTMITEELKTVAKWIEWYATIIVRLLDATTAMKLNEAIVMKL